MDGTLRMAQSPLRSSYEANKNRYEDSQREDLQRKDPSVKLRMPIAIPETSKTPLSLSQPTDAIPMLQTEDTDNLLL